MGTGSAPPTPRLSISLGHTAGFTQGQTGAYTITVSNAEGAGATSGAVSVTDAAPPGLTIASMSGTGWTCSFTVCSRSDPLPAGQSSAILVVVDVAANSPAGTSAVINHASLAGGGDPSAPHTAADPTTIAP